METPNKNQKRSLVKASDPCPKGDRDNPQQSAADVMMWASRNNVRLPDCVDEQISMDMCPEAYPDDPYVD